jgi:transposase
LIAFSINEQQMEGSALAQKRGVYKGRKKFLSAEQVEEIKNRIQKSDKKTHN